MTSTTQSPKAGDLNADKFKELEGKTVKNTNDNLDTKKGKIEKVERDHLYGGKFRATITYPGNIGREGVLAEKLAQGETRWEVI